jgi:hypothetical protein
MPVGSGIVKHYSMHSTATVYAHVWMDIKFIK